MIDDKKIEEVARAYGKLGESPAKAPKGSISLELETAFEIGAHWALKEFLKDLWHPIEEEPTLVGEEIVLEVFVNSKRHTIVRNYMVGENPNFRSPYETIRWINNWNLLLNPRDGVEIKRWFYLKDLLTKTEEQ